jgi:hypothetical protein
VAREIANKLSAPGRRKGTISVPDMCVTVRKIWAVLVSFVSGAGLDFQIGSRLMIVLTQKNNIDELNAKSAELLEESVHGTLGFSPLNVSRR